MNLDYADWLGLDEIVWRIEGLDTQEYQCLLRTKTDIIKKVTFVREMKHGLYLHCENFFYIGLKCGSKSFCLKEEHRPFLDF